MTKHEIDDISIICIVSLITALIYLTDYSPNNQYDD